MSNYLRETRECAFDQLRPELRQAFDEYINNHAMELEPGGLICCETTSTRKPLGWLARWLNAGEPEITHSAILLAPAALLWARSSDNGPAHVSAARLFEIRVKKYSSSLVGDSGLEIAGAIADSRGLLRGYIGLGPEQAASEFCDKVVAAVELVNPRSKGFLPPWLSGR